MLFQMCSLGGTTYLSSSLLGPWALLVNLWDIAITLCPSFIIVRQHFDFSLSGRRFLKICRAEFNETWYNKYIEGVVDARYLIFKIGSFSAPWWKIEFSARNWLSHLELDLCGRRFLNNYRAEFNETWYEKYIEGVVDARYSIFKIGPFSTPWWKIEFSARNWLWLIRLGHRWTKVPENLRGRIRRSFVQQLYRSCCWCTLFDFLNQIIQLPWWKIEFSAWKW